MIAFAFEHQFVAGFAIGGLLWGGAFGILGWLVGYDHAMRKVAGWTRRKHLQDRDVFGDMPTLPPLRERRYVGRL